MAGFNLTSSALCPECNQYLSEQGASHDCIPWEKRTHVFRRIGSGETYTVEATSINAAWRHLAQETGDPLPWIHVSGDVSAAYYARTGQDLRDL